MSLRSVGPALGVILFGFIVCCGAYAQQIVENGVPIGANTSQSTATVVNLPAGGDVVSAVAQVASAGGGTVNLAAGVYNITSSINLGSNVTINGQGSSTIIYAPQTPNGVAMMAAANGAVSNVIIENLVLDGNVPPGAFGQGGEYANSGIYLYGNNNAVSNILVKNVEIRNTGIGILMTVTNAITLNGVYVHDNNPGNFAHNAYLVGCDFVYILHSRFMHAHTGDGLHFDFSASYYLISKSEFSQNHGEGVLDQGGGSINIQDSIFNWNVNDGLNASSTGELLTRSLASYNNGYGFNIQGGEASFDLVGFGDGGGIGFFNYGAGAFGDLINSTTPNQYLAILANGVTGATDTADWVTSLSGYQGGSLSGYSSIGAVDFNVNHLSNGLLTFPSVGAVGAGAYSTTWAYSNGTAQTLAMPVTVNGASAGTISFPPTGSWSTWSTVNVTLNLRDGGNVVSVSPQSGGAPLLDYLQVNTAVPAAPAAPTGVAVSALGPYSTQLTWNPVPGASSYSIIRSGAVIAVGVSGTSYTDNDILLGSSTYTYSVFAVNQGGGGPASASVGITTPIDAPAGLQLSASSSGNVLNWLSSNGAVNYLVLRSYVSGGPYTNIATTSQQSYTDSTATPNVMAYYVVEAVNAAGTASVNSYELGVLTQVPPNTFILNLASQTFTLQLNSGGTIAVSVIGGSGFSGTVSFSAAGFPSGVGNTFLSPSSTTGTTLVMFVPAATAPGTYPITVTGTSGILSNSKTFSLIVPAPQTITFNAIASQPAGSSFTLAATASSGLPVSFTSSTPAVCTVSGTTATLRSTGTCTIVASQSGNGANNPAAAVTQSFSVVAQGFTLSVATAAVTLAQGSSGSDAVSIARLNGFSGSITYAVTGLPSSVTGSVSGNALNLNVSGTAAQGSYPVTITGTSGNLVATCSLTLVVAAPVPQAQTLTFNAIANQTAATSLSLTATSSSGLAVSFAATTPAVCSVAGTTASLLAAGTCTIVASQAGNGSYAAAASVAQSFSVVSPSFALNAAAATLTQKPGSSGTDVITVTPQGGFSGSVSYSVAGLPSGVTGTFSGDTLQVSVSATTVPGVYPLTITGSSAGSSAEVDVKLSVAAASSTTPTTPNSTTETVAGASSRSGGGALDLWTLAGLTALSAIEARRRLESARQPISNTCVPDEVMG